jgi:hypothetical protein
LSVLQHKLAKGEWKPIGKVELRMTYASVDKLQSALATEVFHYAKDSKKAAGRALGTMIELVTFYLLKDWGLEDSIRIEKGLIEYRNAQISHNVEYTLHPVMSRKKFIAPHVLPLSSTKILGIEDLKKSFNLADFQKISSNLISTNGILKNSCLLGRGEISSLIAVMDKYSAAGVAFSVIEQFEKPYAMIECKRVGVEDGMKKGPQTIEKAKQGAYVAKMVSSLQKLRNYDGQVYGFLPLDKGKHKFDIYETILKEVIDSSNLELYKDFILTIGIVSNHGNWFTSDNPNKELLVLSDAYDWLLFLTDNGLATFIEELLLNPKPQYKAARNAFISSYSSDDAGIKKSGKNQFTKTQIAIEADAAIQDYFRDNRKGIEGWFNIITPAKRPISQLRSEIASLAAKKWK